MGRVETILMNREIFKANTMYGIGIDKSVPEIPIVNDRSKNKTSPHELLQYFIGQGEVRGFTFKQVFSNESGYIYQVTQPGGVTHYEVVRRIINRRFNCISYPGSKSFGLTAWTCRTLDDALLRFNSLQK